MTISEKDMHGNIISLFIGLSRSIQILLILERHEKLEINKMVIQLGLVFLCHLTMYLVFLCSSGDYKQRQLGKSVIFNQHHEEILKDTGN